MVKKIDRQPFDLFHELVDFLVGLLCAFGADAVAELGIGVSLYINLHLTPVPNSPVPARY